MVMSDEENGLEDVRVKKDFLYKLLTCSICNNMFTDPVSITECFHIFCNRCISKKIQEDDLNSCPECNIYLGSVPLDKLVRPDHSWTSIREALFTSLGKAGKQDDEPEFKDSEILNGEAKLPITMPGRRKHKSLSSLENKINTSGTNGMGRRRKSTARKVFPSGGSATRIQNPHKLVEAHSESKRYSMNINNCAQDDKQSSAVESSKQQSPTTGRERAQRSDKKIELVTNLLKPLDDLAEAGKVKNISKTVSEGDMSSKVINISDSEGKSSEKNFLSYNADSEIGSTPTSLPTAIPVRKNRGRPKKTVEPQGLISAQTIIDTASSQHARRVAPVWLSLVSSANQKGVELLPHIPRCFLMIKHLAKPMSIVLTLFWWPRNVTQTISFIKKYLVQKLGLNGEDEVEISFCGTRLPHDLELRQLVDLWSQTMSSSEKLQAVVGESGEQFVMVLTYGRKHPQH